MTCAEVDDLVEGLAAGAPAPAVAEQHLSGCPTCRRRLQLARTVHAVLAARPPLAAAGLLSAILVSVRQERWRAERYVDAGFNVALGLAATLVVGGGLWLWLAIFGSPNGGVGIGAVFRAGVTVLGPRFWTTLATYGAGALLILVALAVWWWAERWWTT